MQSVYRGSVKFIFTSMNPVDSEIGISKIKKRVFLNWKADDFVSASGFLRDFFVRSSGILRELPKDSRRFPEGFPKKTIKRQATGTMKLKNT
jgi:hypothetical protein